MNTQQRSMLFNHFNEILNTANNFKNYFQAYLTIKSYAFSSTQQFIQQGRGQLYENEYNEYNKQYQYFNQEVNSVGGQNVAFLNKDNFENFLVQTFSSIDFNTCDLITLNLTNNLINSMTQFGNLPSKFASHQQFVLGRISQQNQSNQNQQLQQNIQNLQNLQSNSNSNTNNKVNQGSEPTKPKPRVEVNTKTTDFNTLINKNIKLPVKKGTDEFVKLKGVIQEHLCLAEQEALYNKLDFSRAHMEVALYYLKNIVE